MTETIPSQHMLRDCDVFYFSNVEWSLFQRPQSISLELVKRGCRVFYVEPMISVGSLLHSLFISSDTKISHPSADGLTVLKPFLSLSTFRSGSTGAIDRYLFRKWFHKVRSKYQLRSNPVIIVNLPYWWGNILDRTLFPDGCIVYDCSDDCRVHSRNVRIFETMAASEAKLAGDADICLTTSDALYGKISSLNKSTYLVPNAVNPDFFIENSSCSPTDLLQYQKPLYGFIGSLYEHIDFDVIIALSGLITEGTIVLVGFTDRMEELQRLTNRFKNIIYLGPRPYHSVPAYIRAFDVCLIPYKAGGRIDTVNPVKLNEYFMFGAPIIGLKTGETEKYGEYVYLYRDISELADILTQVLSEKQDDPIQQERIKYAVNNSWKKRVEQIAAIMGNLT